jgi:hypothetical protein
MKMAFLSTALALFSLCQTLSACYNTSVVLFRKTDFREVVRSPRHPSTFFLHPQEIRQLTTAAANGKPTRVFVYYARRSGGQQEVVLEDNSIISASSWNAFVFASPSLYFFANTTGVYRHDDSEEYRLPFNSRVFAYDSKTDNVVFARRNVVSRVRNDSGGDGEQLFSLPCPTVVMLQSFDDVILSLCSDGQLFVGEDFLLSFGSPTFEIPFFATRTSTSKLRLIRIPQPNTTENLFFLVVLALLGALTAFLIRRYKAAMAKSETSLELTDMSKGRMQATKNIEEADRLVLSTV